MAVNIANSLAGLSLLTGDATMSSIGTALQVQSRAIRDAKKAFTAPQTTPPWKEAAPSTAVSAQVSAIKAMTTIIDKGSTSLSKLPDIQTSFVAYKALERLRLLAEAAAKTTTSSLERGQLAKGFVKGIEDLQTFLGQAPSDKVKLSFGLPTRRAESVGIAPAVSTGMSGSGLTDRRDAPIPGLVGNEVLKVTLSKYNISETVTVDLSQSTQPPTVDSVAQAINTAIQAIPLRNPDGSAQLDENGNAVPRWLSRFVPDKTSGKWGFKVDTPGVEKVAIDQVGAPDALMVASGLTSLDAPTTAGFYRFDDAAGGHVRKTLGTIAAVDARATAEQANLPAKIGADGKPIPAAGVAAATNVKGIATDAQGFTYVVGTTAGDLGSNVSDGANDLFLTKLDSEGKAVWHRTLGAAGSAEGAAISVGAGGEIVVAGTVSSAFAGSAGGDTDMLVMKFDGSGNELFATSIRALGNDEASAVTVAADGSIFVGGRTTGGNGDAFLARVDASGRLGERRVIDSGGADSIKALAVSADGELLALSQESGTARLRKIDAGALATDLGMATIGPADARAIAVAADGSITVGGAASGSLPGAQVNAASGGRDGFVVRLGADLGNTSVTYLGTAEDDQVDSIAFMGSDLFVGGRTTGGLEGTRRGAVDGFAARLDAAAGTIETVSQFGQPAQRAEPVRVAALKGGSSVLGALGLHRGLLNPDGATKVTAETALRAGDSFGIRINGGTLKKIVIGADNTLLTLADRIRKITGTAGGTVTTPKVGNSNALRIEAKPGHAIELVAGPEGTDALEKLGIEPARLYAQRLPNAKDPVVKPGGVYGLNLNDGLSISTTASAAAALDRLKEAISTTQTAYRSLYWDDAKARRVDGVQAGSGGGSPYQQAQIASYQAALDRLTAGTTATTFTGF